ncbi:MAG: type II toxin-antitoxin system HipA family toxin [Candidatus Thiodiazotropha sp. (ex Epidulcina cf. delphinae)]|nr:type II toxin-antitoxin system HipA family toxin [Candidatus Thiodiazotropha sp. (ex Epidulcina cf. delphinae)]
MISEEPYSEAFVWVWLPGETQPVVAGRLAAEGDQLIFNYGKSYLARDNAIALYDPELPLQAGLIPLLPGLSMPACIRDASPDAWGRRIIINRKFGLKGMKADPGQLDELTCLLESGSDRIGALDFQRSATKYVPRGSVNASLDELVQAAEFIEKGLPLSPELDQALQHGTSLGGARPKAQLEDGDKKYIAKFSSTTDLYSVVKAEYIAMRLAAQAGLNVAKVSLTSSLHKDVLLIERFDRVPIGAGWQRKIMVSALTVLALDEMMARYASYEDLAEIIRHRFTDAPATLREIYSRLVFNILCGNTDDHARNHAAFWNGETLTLTPAYDICPQGRTGNEVSQAMLLAGNNRMSRISSCLETAAQFLLPRAAAIDIVESQLTSIINHWDAISDEASLSATDRAFLWGRQFLNPYAFEDLNGDAAHLKVLADKARLY